MYCIFFYPSIDGYLGCLHILGIVNVVINMGLHIYSLNPVFVFIFLVIYPEVDFSGVYGSFLMS